MGRALPHAAEIDRTLAVALCEPPMDLQRSRALPQPELALEFQESIDIDTGCLARRPAPVEQHVAHPQHRFLPHHHIDVADVADEGVAVQGLRERQTLEQDHRFAQGLDMADSFRHAGLKPHVPHHLPPVGVAQGFLDSRRHNLAFKAALDQAYHAVEGGHSGYAFPPCLIPNGRRLASQNPKQRGKAFSPGTHRPEPRVAWSADRPL